MSASLERVAANPDARQQLQEADWADIGVRLTAYAVWKAQNFRWRTRDASFLAAGKTPEDVAREAIVKVLDGTRVWDPERGPLLAYLRRVVDSLMSHLASSADNVLFQSFDATDHPPFQSEPAATVLGDDRIERLRNLLADRRERDLLAVLDAAEPCGPKPGAIALRLGTTAADINNRLKRLRRLALKLLQPSAATKSKKVGSR